MKEIIKIYKNFSEKEKQYFKEVLNDFLDYIEQNKEKNNSYFHKEEKEKIAIILKNTIEKTIKADEVFMSYCKQNINSLKEIMKNFLKDSFCKNYENSNSVYFDVYKWEENIENDEKFSCRRKIINLLDKEKIILISPLNIVEEHKKLLKWKHKEHWKYFLDAYNKYKKEIIDIHWERYFERQEQHFLNWEKTREFILFKKEEIEEFLKEIEKIDNKKIIFINWCLRFDWKMYIPKKHTNRFLFLELFFSKEAWKLIHKEEIINYLENWAWDFYNEEQRKKVLDLYNWLNKTIEKKLWIKNFFELWKDDNKDFISRKF